MPRRRRSLEPTAGLSLVSVFLMSAAACASTGGPPEPATGTLEVTVTSGPTCPEVRDPDPERCADRPVEGALVQVLDRSGNEVASAESGNEGTFELELEPGTYELRPQMFAGLPGTAPPVEVEIQAETRTSVTLRYDTGIR